MTEPEEMLELQPRLAASAALFAAFAPASMLSQSWAQSSGPADASAVAASTGQPRTFEISEFRVEGSRQLSSIEVESAVYPFLGPGRVLADVEGARAALEKAYTDRGYQSISVAIPPQTVRGGVVLLKVKEGTVGRLRVRGARWFSPRDVAEQAPSVAEGTVPNFDLIVRDIVALNQIPDRRVTPSLRAGSRPGTVDVDLIVEDTLPLHASVELNDRHGRFTTHLRAVGSLRYDNLWQLGHSLALSYQLAPKRPSDGRVFSTSYLARFSRLPWFTFSANYLNQNSDVSTVGGINVAGTGEIAGGRLNFTLPGVSGFYHVIATGLDYKRFGQQIRLGQQEGDSTPLTTWPVAAQYSAIVSTDASETQLTLGPAFNLRSISSSTIRFDERRYNSFGAYIYYRGEVSHTERLPLDLQFFAKLQGQYSTDPLFPADQFSAGGVDSVRGYHDSEVVGDFGTSGSVELRSPSLARFFGSPTGEWRFHGFFDAGWLGIHSPLPEQTRRFRLSGTGGGTRLKLRHLIGELEIAVPLRTEGITPKYQTRIHFRLAATF